MLEGYLPMEAGLSRVQLWILQFSTRETIAETLRADLTPKSQRTGNVYIHFFFTLNDNYNKER